MQVAPRYYDEVGRGNLTTEQEREIREKLPAFEKACGRLMTADRAMLCPFLF